MNDTIRLDPSDNVETALRALVAGEGGASTAIPRGHKLAVRDIAKGEPVLKYAQIIGWASEDIAAGAHIHTHNLEFRNISHDYDFGTNLRPVGAPEQQDMFRGYRRANGKVGTRNYIAILTSVNCSATAARQIAAHFTPERLAAFPNVDGVTAFVHGTGCGMASNGEGFETLQRVMWGYARNPNVGGVLMAGLGCEANQIDWLIEAFGLTPGPLFQTMNIQDVGGLRKTIALGIQKVEAMLPLVNAFERTPCPASSSRRASASALSANLLAA